MPKQQSSKVYSIWKDQMSKSKEYPDGEILKPLYQAHPEKQVTIKWQQFNSALYFKVYRF